MTALPTSSNSSGRLFPALAGWGELFDVQLLVARRADALARRWCGAGRDGDRRVWLRAELEVFERIDHTCPAGADA